MRKEILGNLGFKDIDSLVNSVIPESIRKTTPLQLSSSALSENEALKRLRAIARKNKVSQSFIGAGFNDTYTPGFLKIIILF